MAEVPLKPRPPQPRLPRIYPFSYRLLLSFDGRETVSLVRQQRIEMIAPPSLPFAPQPGRQSGSWIEVRVGSQIPLYQRSLVDPFQTRVEHHTKEGRIEVYRRPLQAGQIEVIVPDVQRTNATLTFFSDSLGNRDPGLIALAARPVFTTKLPGSPN